MPEPRPTMTAAMRRVLLFGVAYAGLLALVSSATRSSDGIAPLILITVDTLRADRLECYGYTKIKTPHINRLAADGTLFSNAFAQVPLTLPSHWSILTGTYPTFHGVRHNAYTESRPGTPRLTEALKSGGYTNAAFVASFVLDRRFGLARGFDFYFDNFGASRHEGVSPADVERQGDVVVKAFAGWMNKQTSSRFFAWIHLFDPHDPYNPPEPFRSLYSGSPYDGEVAFVDRLVGEIVSLLQSKYSNATIIFTADHGEALGEHGEQTHGLFLYDASLHVPLIVKTGGIRKGTVIDSQVRSIDIAPTILALAGLQRPGLMQGTDLVPLLRGERPKVPSVSYSETYYPTYGFGWSALQSVRTQGFKYIAAPRPELYDLAKDPKESRNVVATSRAAAARMKDLLFETVRLSSVGAPQKVPVERPVDPATLERLRSLGYVAAAPPTASSSARRDLPDPKDKATLFSDTQKALAASNAGRSDEAIRLLQKVLSEDSGISTARLVLGIEYQKRKEYGKAAAEFRRAVASDPRNAVAAFNLALSYAHLNRPEDAVAGFLRTLELDPTYTRAHSNLGVIYQKQNRLEEAVKHYRHALAIDRDDFTAASNLAVIYAGRGKLDEALVNARRAVEIATASPDAYRTLGSVHLVRNEHEAAIEAYRKGTSLAPDRAELHYLLAQAYRKAGRTAEAEAALAKYRSLTAVKK